MRLLSRCFFCPSFDYGFISFTRSVAPRIYNGLSWYDRWLMVTQLMVNFSSWLSQGCKERASARKASFPGFQAEWKLCFWALLRMFWSFRGDLDRNKSNQDRHVHLYIYIYIHTYICKYIRRWLVQEKVAGKRRQGGGRWKERSGWGIK